MIIKQNFKIYTGKYENLRNLLKITEIIRKITEIKKNLRKLFTAKIVKIIRCYLIILFLKKFQRIKVIRKLNKYFDPNWLRKVHGFKYKQNLKIINFAF